MLEGGIQLIDIRKKATIYKIDLQDIAPKQEMILIPSSFCPESFPIVLLKQMKITIESY